MMGQLKQLSVRVTGLNGIGRQVALQLAALRPGQLRLIDARPVRPQQHTVQGYPTDDIGGARRHAVAEQCHHVRPQLDVTSTARSGMRTIRAADVVFCCAGPARARAALLKRTAARVQWYIDVQVIGKRVQVMSASDPYSRRSRARQLTRQTHAENPDTPLHVAAIAAGLAVEAFLAATTGPTQPARLVLNLKSCPFSCRFVDGSHYRDWGLRIGSRARRQ